MKILVVGAGLAGCTVARQCAEAGHSVHIIDKRDHIAGNIYDHKNPEGVYIHEYGPHLFHTSDNSVKDYVSRFSDWICYSHEVRAMLGPGRYTDLPVNLQTLLDVYGTDSVEDAIAKCEFEQQESLRDPDFESYVSSSLGVFRASYGKTISKILFEPYTKKMWGVPANELEASIGKRLSIRKDFRKGYFNDDFQALPKNGYTELIKNMVDHNAINVVLSSGFNHNLLDSYDHCFLSIPIDEFFDYCYGKLSYRSIDFTNAIIPKLKDANISATTNYTDNGPYTRFTLWDKLPNSNVKSQCSYICIERPCDPSEVGGEVYYPLRNGSTLATYEQYKIKAKSIPNVTFIGRTGMFAYLDMAPCISAHLKLANSFLNK